MNSEVGLEVIVIMYLVAFTIAIIAVRGVRKAIRLLKETIELLQKAEVERSEGILRVEQDNNLLLKQLLETQKENRKLGDKIMELLQQNMS